MSGWIVICFFPGETLQEDNRLTMLHNIQILNIAFLWTVFLVACKPQAAIVTPVATEQAPSQIPLPTKTVVPVKPPTPTVSALPTITDTPTVTLPAPTSVPIPTPTATAVPIDLSRISSGAVVLFARDDDLWRTDLDGHEIDRLSEGGLLNWGWDREDDFWWMNATLRPPYVSPDGRWIAFASTGKKLVLDVAAPGMARLIVGSGDGPMAWSPDSRFLAYGPHSLYVYDPEADQANKLLTGYGGGIHNISWSPDGRSIGFVCCFKPPADQSSGDPSIGEIQRVEVATGQVETVGEATSTVGGGPSHFCWTAENQVITSTGQAVRCSSDAVLHYVSPDGTQIAYLSSVSSEDTDFNLLIVQQTATGEIAWQQDVASIRPNVVFWSPDGQYLLLDDSLQKHSPIWRTKADGSGELEIVVEDGFLLNVIPAWQ